jgi:hypothetical protein
MDNDTAWCPACDRQIQPKRTLVPITPTTPPTPAPPPSSPQAPNPTVRRTKAGTVRQRGGLVQGTGRVKPNGSLKRTESKPSQQPPPQPAPPVKYRTVIDQGPTLLYCSDECRMADIHTNHGGALPHNYNPDRQSLTPSPVPFSRRAADSDSTGSSLESQSSVSSASSSQQPLTHQSPSLATLAAIYNWGPPPPPAHVDENTEETCIPNEYSSGVMMAARRIAELCPKPQKRNAYGHIISPTEPRKPIPGWTDGSNAWRSSIYSFTSPRQSPTGEAKAYKSFTATPHRSRGVQSTVGSSSGSSSRPTTSSLPADTNEMITKFSESFNRRSESRASLYSGSPSPSVGSFSSTAPTRRERSLLQPGAEGKLLVPDVKMRVHSGSSASLSSVGSPSSRKSVRSPLSSSCSDEDRCDTLKRPTVESELPLTIMLLLLY